jgi:hypothetical protein
MAKQTLANERVSLSQGGLRWGHGPTARDLVDAVRARGGIEPGRRRDRLLSAYIDGEILRYHRLALVAAKLNKKPGPDASLRKALADPRECAGLPPRHALLEFAPSGDAFVSPPERLAFWARLLLPSSRRPVATRWSSRPAGRGALTRWTSSFSS